MPKLPVYNITGQTVGEVELSDAIFGIENVNQHAVYETIKNILANRRQGTQSAKTRAEVRGGGRKPWRQKGTGRARAGSIRQPNWKGGGVVFAPKPRDYSYAINKKVRSLAMRSALTVKVAEESVIVLDALQFAAPKTKEMISVLNNLKVSGKALIVTADREFNVMKSSSNLQGVKTTMVGELNVYDILNHEKFIITMDAVKKVEEVYA